MRPLTYLSVCSGIEAASVAWEPIGWRPWAFSEIDPFPCRVLAHRFGSNMPGEALAQNGVPNLGDMTRFQEWPDAAIDLLVGGTPCQDYSVAGKRAGMAGSRGQLTLTFLEIAARYRPQWIVWENVPGVLSSNGGKDFAAFLWDLGKLGYGWAYQVLDAQYVRTRRHPRAVPQRRRRVFVVGYLGDWRPPAAVFLDAEGLRGDPPPRRGAGERPAPTISARPSGGGGLGTDFDLDGGLICANSGDVGYCLTASAQQSLDAETETLIAVAHTVKAEGFDASEDGTGRGIPLMPVVFASDVAPTMRAGGNETGGNRPYGTDADTSDSLIAVAHTLKAEGFDASEDGTGRGIPLVPVAFHPQAGGKQTTLGFDPSSGIAATIEANQVQAVAFDLRGREGGAMPEGPHDTANIRAADGGSSRSYVATAWSVRRLTPMECERLQGFPDGWTQVPVRGKPAADGPRYKALGNSMAVNVMEFIGQRIELVRAEMAAMEAAQ